MSKKWKYDEEQWYTSSGFQKMVACYGISELREVTTGRVVEFRETRFGCRVAVLYPCINPVHTIKALKLENRRKSRRMMEWGLCA